MSVAIYKVVQHWQASFIHSNLQMNILCIYICTIGHWHQHGDCSSIGISLRQGMSVATYKVLWHRQATLIHENLQSVLASATNSYLQQMTKCFSISSPHPFAAISVAMAQPIFFQKMDTVFQIKLPLFWEYSRVWKGPKAEGHVLSTVLLHTPYIHYSKYIYA